MSAIRAIFFDAVGTLIHPEPPAAVVYAEVGRRFGSTLMLADIQKRFLLAFEHEEAADFDNGLRTSEEREIERWRNIVWRVLDDVRDPEACFQELYHHFSRPEAWRCDTEAHYVLKELSKRGYVVGMASNYDRRLKNVVAGIPALQPLRHLVISSEVGWRKPEIAFFDAVCRMAEVHATEMLFVGDDVGNDYQGATNAGLGAILFDPFGKHKGFAKRQVKQLSDLLALNVLLSTGQEAVTPPPVS